MDAFTRHLDKLENTVLLNTDNVTVTPCFTSYLLFIYLIDFKANYFVFHRYLAAYLLHYQSSSINNYIH